MNINFKDRFSFNRSKRLFLPDEGLDLRGTYYAELYTGKKLVDRFEFKNGITGVGKNYLFNTAFNSGTAVAQGTWAMGLIDGASTPTLSSADTSASHGGWTEFTGYSESTRVAWGPTSSTAQLVANTVLCVFTISVTGVVAGAFIIGQNTKGGSTGVLWSTGTFSSSIPVTSSVDELKLVYQCAS